MDLRNNWLKDICYNVNCTKVPANLQHIHQIYCIAFAIWGSVDYPRCIRKASSSFRTWGKLPQVSTSGSCGFASFRVGYHATLLLCRSRWSMHMRAVFQPIPTSSLVSSLAASNWVTFHRNRWMYETAIASATLAWNGFNWCTTN